MKIFVIIVSYNGAAWIKKCLESLEQSTIPLSIVVIDNKSDDETREIINEFSQVCLIENDTNLGFGQANNIGLKIALKQSADYVFLLNQDAWIDTSTIEKLIEVHQLNNSFGIISPIHLSSDNKSLEYKFKEYIQPPFSDGMVSDIFMNQTKPLYETTFVNAAAWLISRECLQTVGGFDPLFFHYGEDVDYIHRAYLFKFKVGIAYNSKIWHDSKYVSWHQVFWNKSRMQMIYLYELKGVNGSLRGNSLIFLKNRFDELTGHLLYGKFKIFFYKVGLTIGSISLLFKIRRARNASMVKGAFLH